MTHDYTYPPLPAGPVVVTLDGEPMTDVLDNADDAFVWLIRHQGQSVSYALRYGGYKIVAAQATS